MKFKSKLKVKTRFDEFSDFREAKRRKYPIQTIPGFPQGRLIITPKRVLEFDKREKKVQGDFIDAGIIKNGKEIPTKFIIRLANNLNREQKKETFTHEINHWKFKKYMLKEKFKGDKDLNKLLRKNPTFKRGENPREEVIVSMMTQAKLDRKFERKLIKKFPNLHKKIKRFI